MGVGIPGFPNMLMGRTNYLSYGLTYGTMDQHDYFVEEVIDGHVKRPNNKCKYRSGSSLVLFFKNSFRLLSGYITGCNVSAKLQIFYYFVFISPCKAHFFSVK